MSKREKEDINEFDELTQEYIRFCRSFMDEYLITTRNLNYLISNYES